MARPSEVKRNEIIVRYVDAEQCLAWFGNVQFILSLQPPGPEFMRRIISELAALSHSVGRGTGSLLVIKADAAPPSEEARAYMRAELARSSMLAAAQVVEGTGFRGAAMRSVLSMLQLAVRPPYPMKVFDNVVAAAHWLSTELATRAGDAPPMAELAAAAQEVRSRFLTRSMPPFSSGTPSGTRPK